MAIIDITPPHSYYPKITIGTIGTSSDRICTGTDDHEVINDVIESVGVAGGGVIQIRAGNYSGGPISILHPNITLQGEGDATRYTLKAGLGLGQDVIRIGDGGTTTGITNVVVRDMYINGNYANQSVNGIGQGCHGLRLWADNFSVSDCLIDNITIEDTLKGGISCDSATYSVISNIRVYNPRTHGIYSESVSRCLFSNIVVKGATHCGMQLYKTSDSNVVNVEAYDCDRGFEFESTGSRRNTVTNFTSRECRIGFNIHNGDKNTIIGGIATRCQQEGMVIADSNYNTIVGLKIMNCSQEATNTYAGLHVKNESPNFTTNNAFIGVTIRSDTTDSNTSVHSYSYYNDHVNNTNNSLSCCNTSGAGTAEINNLSDFGQVNIEEVFYNALIDGSNYERARMHWTSNVFEIGTESAGTGIGRDLRLRAKSGATTTDLILSRSSAPFLDLTHSSTTILSRMINFGGTSGASGSGTYALMALRPTISQSGSAGYTVLQINATESSTGSGAKLLIDAQIGGSSKFLVSNTGYTTFGASSSIAASINIPIGSAPSSPNNGDIWFDGTDLKIRVSGITKTIILS